MDEQQIREISDADLEDQASVYTAEQSRRQLLADTINTRIIPAARDFLAAGGTCAAIRAALTTLEEDQ